MAWEKFILTADGKMVPEPDMMKWSEWYHTAPERIIGKTDVAGRRVSTVFLGMDNSFGFLETPQFFETMVFGENGDGGEEQRYATLEEAKAGHEAMVAKLKAQLQ